MSAISIKTLALPALLSAVLAAPLLAAPAAPADMVKTRVAGYKALGASNKKVSDMVKSGTLDLVVLKTAAAEINNSAKQQYGWFPAGSGPESGVKTRAKPEIWTQKPQFKAAQDALTNQAKALSAAALTGDLTKVTAASKALGAACSQCHRAFRND